MLIYISISQQRGRIKMGDYPMVELKNVAVVNITFRKPGSLYNEGRIVIDVKTYDFAGHITDDVVVGFYRDGCFNIQYFYKEYETAPSPVPGMPEVILGWKEYAVELSVEFEKTTVEQDFTDRKLFFGRNSDDQYELTFEGFEANPQTIYRTLHCTEDLMKLSD